MKVTAFDSLLLMLYCTWKIINSKPKLLTVQFYNIIKEMGSDKDKSLTSIFFSNLNKI